MPRDKDERKTAEAPRGYYSPPCYAHEIAPGYFGEQLPMPAAELLCLLNTLLEAERAGAKVLSEFLGEYQRGTPAWDRLRDIQRDEGENCAILADLVQHLGGEPSPATGDFAAKALAIEGRVGRLAFLNRGQAWVARKIGEALPRIEDDRVCAALREMQDSHRRNIESCDALLKSL